MDLVVENIGGPQFNELLETTRMWGPVSVVGRLAGPVPEFNTAALFFRRRCIGGVAVATYTQPETRDAWQRVLETLGKTGARPVIDHVFAFDEVLAASARLEAGPMGKVLVKVEQTRWHATAQATTKAAESPMDIMAPRAPWRATSWPLSAP